MLAMELLDVQGELSGPARPNDLRVDPLRECACAHEGEEGDWKGCPFGGVVHVRKGARVGRGACGAQGDETHIL